MTNALQTNLNKKHFKDGDNCSVSVRACVGAHVGHFEQLLC